jgi:hypothetical protein
MATSDLGLGNLQDLKREILPAALRSQTDWDQVLKTIGLGVALAFERHCNRLWKRTAGETDEFRADRAVWVVRRFPIETVSEIAIRDDYATGWVSQSISDVLNVSEESGLVKFGDVLGPSTSEARLTYTGGYWYDTDEAYGTAQPSGTFAVPGDLKAAWLLQCASEFERRDGIQQKTAIGRPKDQEARFSTEMLKDVERTLNAHRRFMG